ncbi:hypothetical protein OG943_32340 [Amycolatopsis sp. NBC_00345]|uniref:hypothetical protein n=1 Tax=Amycolatopsis sp. NBC_00345 TaxID=2975955 RepID=UPI002E25D1DC
MSLTGQQIYENFTGAAGTDNLELIADTLDQVLSEYDRLHQDVAAAAGNLTAYWQGTASDAARAGVSPAADACNEAGAGIAMLSSLLREHIADFHSVRNKVRPVPDVPLLPGSFTEITTLGGQGNHLGEVTAANEAAQANVEAMNTWAELSRRNAALMPTDYRALAPGYFAVQQGGGQVPATPPETGAPVAVPGPRSAENSREPAHRESLAQKGESPVESPVDGGRHVAGAQRPTASPEGMEPAGNDSTRTSASAIGAPAPGELAREAVPTGSPAGGEAGSRELSGRTAAPPPQPGLVQLPGSDGPKEPARGSATTPKEPGRNSGSATQRTTARPVRGAAATEKVTQPGAVAGTPGRGEREDDTEHQRKYTVEERELFDDAKAVDPRTGMKATPPVIGL